MSLTALCWCQVVVMVQALLPTTCTSAAQLLRALEAEVEGEVPCCSLAEELAPAGSSTAHVKQLLRPCSTIVMGALLRDLEQGSTGTAPGPVVELVTRSVQRWASEVELGRAGDSVAGDVVLQLFQEQDCDLVHALMSVQSLWLKWRWVTHHPGAAVLPDLSSGRVAAAPLPAAWHPHQMFHGFLESIGFDHQLLLDFLISNETVFIEYLLQYLRAATEGATYAPVMLIADSVDGSTDRLLQSEAAHENILQCLHTLTGTICNLDQQGIFPYEARPLIRRLQLYSSAMTIDEESDSSNKGFNCRGSS